MAHISITAIYGARASNTHIVAIRVLDERERVVSDLVHELHALVL